MDAKILSSSNPLRSFNPPIRYNRTEEEDIKKVDNKVFSEGDDNYSNELKKIVEGWK